MAEPDPLRTLGGSHHARMMSEPWSRPYAGFSCRLVTRKECTVIAGAVAVAVALGFDLLLVSGVTNGLAVIAAGVGRAVVLWKLEHDYRRS